jgi:hypothetical protein
LLGYISKESGRVCGGANRVPLCSCSGAMQNQDHSQGQSSRTAYDPSTESCDKPRGPSSLDLNNPVLPRRHVWSSCRKRLVLMLVAEVSLPATHYEQSLCSHIVCESFEACRCRRHALPNVRRRRASSKIRFDLLPFIQSSFNLTSWRCNLNPLWENRREMRSR